MDVDTVYIARVTTSASAVWEERGGLTVTVRVDPFGTLDPPGKDPKSRQTTFASVAAISVHSGKGTKSSKPTSIRVKLPRWSSGGSERSTTCTLNGERVRCDDVSAGWCDVRRAWRRTVRFFLFSYLLVWAIRMRPCVLFYSHRIRSDARFRWSSAPSRCSGASSVRSGRGGTRRATGKARGTPSSRGPTSSPRWDRARG